MTDKNDAGPSGWRRYWPDSLVLLFGIGALGAIPGILLAALASWLRRWPSIRTVALWLMIPCLCVTWMVVQNQRRQHLRDVAEARVEQPEAEQATDYAQIAPRPTPVVTEVAANGDAGKTEKKPAAPAATTGVDLEWNAEVARFIADFPALTVPSNGPIFQEKLDLLYSPNKTTKQKLEAAYMAAIADPNWQPAAPVDRVAENANWDKDASTFEKAHPQMFVGANETVLQEYVNALSRPGLTNNQLLELAYRAALADRRWTNKR